MEIIDYTDEAFWDEAKRRCAKQMTLVPGPQRTPVPQNTTGQASAQYPVVCASCGKSTTVPFNPKPGYPVYCLDCYRAGVKR